YIPSERKGRRSPVRYSYPYRDSDTLIITIPKQYTVESLPTPVDIQTPFGSFHSVTVPQGDTALVYTRSMSITATMIPLAQYDDYRSFFQRIVQSDRARAVLIRKAQ
nr:hypothetical protein [Bacteroidota bacterium]